MDFSIFTDSGAWFALLTLTFLEIILGIDNIVFISIVSNKLDAKERPKARNIGLLLAMVFRIALLFAIAWVVSLKEGLLAQPVDFLGMHFNPSGQSIIVFLGGLFLLYKSVSEIHHKLEGDEDENDGEGENSLLKVIFQISVLNAVFSFDSIITAIGIVPLDPPTANPPGFGYSNGILIMVLAIVISIIIMIAFAGAVSRFVSKHPSIQMLGLAFLILIGFMLLIEGMHGANFSFQGNHIDTVPKGYLYFAIFFSLAVEFLNIRMRKTSKPVKLKFSRIKRK